MDNPDIGQVRTLRIFSLKVACLDKVHNQFYQRRLNRLRSRQRHQPGGSGSIIRLIKGLDSDLSYRQKESRIVSSSRKNRL